MSATTSLAYGLAGQGRERLGLAMAVVGWDSQVCCHRAAHHAGHYVSLIKSHNTWLFFDDEGVDSITEQQVQSTFGSTQEYGAPNMDHGGWVMKHVPRWACTLIGSLCCAVSHVCHEL